MILTTNLIIKAFIQSVRMQIYFIDNDEYFPRKIMFHDEDGNFLENNEERMIFYCKGVIETVKKLGWARIYSLSRMVFFISSYVY